MAEESGSRTRQETPNAPSPVLKTGAATGRHSPPTPELQTQALAASYLLAITFRLIGTPATRTWLASSKRPKPLTRFMCLKPAWPRKTPRIS